MSGYNSQSSGRSYVDWKAVMSDLFYPRVNGAIAKDTIHFIDSPYDSSSGIASDDHNQPAILSDNSSCPPFSPHNSTRRDASSTSGSDSSLAPHTLCRDASSSCAVPARVQRDRRRVARRPQYEETNLDEPYKCESRTPLTDSCRTLEVTLPLPTTAIYHRRSRLNSAESSDSSCDSWTPADRARTRPSHHGRRDASPSPITTLPDAVITHVLSYLPLSADLARSARVCRRWYRLAWCPLLWRRVRLDSMTRSPDSALRQITRRLSFDTPGTCVTLEELRASGCTRLTDRALDCVARRCPELRLLDLRGCTEITNIALFDVLSGCVNLEQLLVAGCINITCLSLNFDASQKVRDYGQQVSLRHVDLSDCQSLDDAGLQLLGAACGRLERIHLRRCARVGDAGLARLVSGCGYLREVSVSECARVGDGGARELARLGDGLRYVSVANTRVGSAGMCALAARCRQLRYINARGCARVDDTAIVAVARQCARLKSLDIGRCGVGDTSLRALATHCARMRKLSLCGCTSVSNAGVAALAGGCPMLEQLNVQECPRLGVEAFRAIRSSCHRCIVEHTTLAFF